MELLYYLAGLFKLLISPILLILAVKKLNVRFTPFVVGIIVYVPIFLLRAMLRSMLPRDDAVTNFVMQAVLTSVIEESGRAAAFLYVMKHEKQRGDAVSYGLGHAAWENFGAGILTMGLPLDDSVKLSASAAAEGSLAMLFGTFFHIAMSVLVLYGVKSGKTRYILPTAMLIHFVTVIVFSGNVFLEAVETILLCFGAYKLYESMDEYE